jgi:hypothetical protein
MCLLPVLRERGRQETEPVRESRNNWLLLLEDGDGVEKIVCFQQVVTDESKYTT